MPEPDSVSVLRTLPLARWAQRLVGGTVRLEGRLDDSLRLRLGDVERVLNPGPAALVLQFRGGEAPELSVLEVTSSGARLRGTEGLGATVEALLDGLHDVSIEVTVHTDGDVVLELGNGLQATIVDGGSITLTASAEGTPAAPRLVEPLRVDVADHGIRVTHSGAPGLSRMARVRVNRFALHPDGSVHLGGGGRGLLDLAVTSGLRRASDRLSTMVRESPRFAQLRAFLHPTTD